MRVEVLLSLLIASCAILSPITDTWPVFCESLLHEVFSRYLIDHTPSPTPLARILCTFPVAEYCTFAHDGSDFDGARQGSCWILA